MGGGSGEAAGPGGRERRPKTDPLPLRHVASPKPQSSRSRIRQRSSGGPASSHRTTACLLLSIQSAHQAGVRELLSKKLSRTSRNARMLGKQALKGAAALGVRCCGRALPACRVGAACADRIARRATFLLTSLASFPPLNSLPQSRGPTPSAPVLGRAGRSRTVSICA